MDLRKLQRVIVDALEDVKAQDIRVYNTQGMTDLFDRVVLASGTSNRQTRALASHVADKVKQAGGGVISVEGEDTGEWLLVDLGDAVVHIMQPAIRAYYNLEEIWGAKPVKVKLAGGAGPSASAARMIDDDAEAQAPAVRPSKRVAMAEAADAEARERVRRNEARAAAKAGTGPRTAAGPAAAARAPGRSPASRSLTGLRSATTGSGATAAPRRPRTGRTER